MNIYLTIMVTALVLTQIIRVTQNHISLRRQEKALRRDLAWIKRAEPTEKDFENQREVFRLFREKLERENEAVRKCYTCGYLGEHGLYEGGGESPCANCANHDLWRPKEVEE